MISKDQLWHLIGSWYFGYNGSCSSCNQKTLVLNSPSIIEDQLFSVVVDIFDSLSFD